VDKGWIFVLVGIVLLLLGCSSGTAPFRSAWNVANATAVETKAEIEGLHEADTQAIIESPTLTKAQKIEALDHVAARWAPAYRAFRVFRAALASARVALTAAEAAELAGHEPDLSKLAGLISAALTAQQALSEAIP